MPREFKQRGHPPTGVIQKKMKLSTVALLLCASTVSCSEIIRRRPLPKHNSASLFSLDEAPPQVPLAPPAKTDEVEIVPQENHLINLAIAQNNKAMIEAMISRKAIKISTLTKIVIHFENPEAIPITRFAIDTAVAAKLKVYVDISGHDILDLIAHEKMLIDLMERGVLDPMDQALKSSEAARFDLMRFFLHRVDKNPTFAADQKVKVLFNAIKFKNECDAELFKQTYGDLDIDGDTIAKSHIICHAILWNRWNVAKSLIEAKVPEPDLWALLVRNKKFGLIQTARDYDYKMSLADRKFIFTELVEKEQFAIALSLLDFLPGASQVEVDYVTKKGFEMLKAKKDEDIANSKLSEAEKKSFTELKKTLTNVLVSRASQYTGTGEGIIESEETYTPSIFSFFS